MVVDVTGVNPVATSGWTDFLYGYASAYVDAHRKGLNPLARAAQRKDTNEDAIAARQQGITYSPAVFLRTGGLHKTFLDFLSPLFPRGLNDFVVAPRFGRTTIYDVVVDDLSRIIANGNVSVLANNVRVAEARQEKAGGRLTTAQKAQVIDLTSKAKRRKVQSSKSYSSSTATGGSATRPADPRAGASAPVDGWQMSQTEDPDSQTVAADTHTSYPVTHSAATATTATTATIAVDDAPTAPQNAIACRNSGRIQRFGTTLIIDDDTTTEEDEE
jgi:hypothetical protein